MSVYFIRAGGYFKIGASRDPQRRCDRLHLSGTRYTFPVGVSLDPADRELYRAVDGWKSEEGQIHLALDDFAVGLEWFLDEPPVREFIDSLPDSLVDRRRPVRIAKVERLGGWCEREYREVQAGRGERETARFYAARDKRAARSA